MLFASAPTSQCGTTKTDPAALVFGWTHCDAARRRLRHQTVPCLIAAAGLTLETQRELSPSCLFRWAEKCKVEKKKQKNKIKRKSWPSNWATSARLRGNERSSSVCLMPSQHTAAQVCDGNYAQSRAVEIFNFNPQLCEKMAQFVPWPTFSSLSMEAVHTQPCHRLLSMVRNQLKKGISGLMSGLMLLLKAKALFWLFKGLFGSEDAKNVKWV